VEDETVGVGALASRSARASARRWRRMLRFGPGTEGTDLGLGLEGLEGGRAEEVEEDKGKELEGAG
jgi:hypothetical protein